MSKQYMILFRDPVQKAMQAIWNSMDIRALSRNGSPIEITTTQGVITTDSSVNITDYETKLKKSFKEEGYELIALWEVAL